MNDVVLWVNAAPLVRAAVVSYSSHQFHVVLKDLRVAIDGCGNTYAGMASDVDLYTAISVAQLKADKRLRNCGIKPETVNPF